MKRLLFIILLFGVCLHVNQAHAQRCLPGMRGIQLTGGLSDNMRWKNGNGFGYHAGIAVSAYTKNAHHWVVGAEYLEKRYGYRDCLYPASQFTGEGGYYLNFLSDRKKTFFAALGLSALLLAAVNLTAEQQSEPPRGGEHGVGVNWLYRNSPFAESRNCSDYSLREPHTWVKENAADS